MKLRRGHVHVVYSHREELYDVGTCKVLPVGNPRLKKNVEMISELKFHLLSKEADTCIVLYTRQYLEKRCIQSATHV